MKVKLAMQRASGGPWIYYQIENEYPTPVMKVAEGGLEPLQIWGSLAVKRDRHRYATFGRINET